ncbi:flagellar biosynthesis protein [Kushneria sinocarnis]|uniref:Flagellar biosynthetic protein FlhB n=1 Tax=Kushneria sinocarnis TaxID=595502 RepID=A0A420WY25_9GAMM|nr:EscU/YscU/HrcU family type III secretion system export apparatus switch protein [Kushneria sinocarnis]RKR06061.1 flagellar biosynthesis protein [Kushneria sinocarnis]
MAGNDDSRDTSAGEESRRSAVAIAYSDQDAAPRVVAKGYGLTAERIIEQANAHGLYVHQSRELVQLLMPLDLDERIPAALYLAIAELLAWVYEMDQKNDSPEHGHSGPVG